LASAGSAATPVPGLNIVLDLALICKEIWLYRNAFGFGQQIVKEISKHDYLRKKLSASSIIEIEAANEATPNINGSTKHTWRYPPFHWAGGVGIDSW
jgi:hypothetical protein